MDSRAQWILAAIALTAVACDGGSTSSALRVEIIDPRGDNAAAGIVEGTLAVEVRQGDRVLSCGSGRCESPIRNGEFDLTFPIESFDTLTSLQARIAGGATPLVGATPRFSPFGEGLDVGLSVRVVMLEPGTCRALDVPGVRGDGRVRLASARRDAAVAVRRNLALVAGGVEAGDVASARVDFLDQIVVENAPLDPAPLRLGAARGLALSEDDSLIVADGGALVVRRQMGPPAQSVIAVHERAGFASALAALDAGGAAVIGGDASATVSWLGPSGDARSSSTLVTERAFASAAEVGRAVLVVGGAAPGEPTAELLETSTGEASALDLGLPEGSGGVLARSPSGRSLLWIGWVDAGGAPSARTFVITGCPSGCVASEGPTWSRPRAGVASVPTAAGATWLVGGDDGAPSDATDRVLWDETETPTIVDGPTLSAARAGAAAVEHASGIVLIAGGEGPDGLRDDVELCAPASLDPI